MEWIPAIISITAAVVVWVNLLSLVFTGDTFIDWFLSGWWWETGEVTPYDPTKVGTIYIDIIPDGNARTCIEASTGGAVSVPELADAAVPGSRLPDQL